MKSYQMIPFWIICRMILQKGVNKKLISKDEYLFILNNHPTIATFYALPKVHKHQQQPPGRPIVSGNCKLTEGASKYVDFIMRPFVCELPSYIESTQNFMNKLTDIILEEDILLASLAVKALYSNIDHKLGIADCKYFLHARGTLFKEHIEMTLELLQYILEHNLFLFKDRIYRQKRDTAMGTACAATYANLFLRWWERT